MRFGSKAYFWSIRLFGLFGLLVLLGAQQKAVAFALPKAIEAPAPYAPDNEREPRRREPLTLQQTLPDGLAVRPLPVAARSNSLSRELPILPQVGKPSSTNVSSSPIAVLIAALIFDLHPASAAMPANFALEYTIGDRFAYRACISRTGPPSA